MSRLCQETPFGAVAPADDHGADDHRVFKHERAVGPSAIGAQEAKLFVQAALPDNFAGFAFQTAEVARDAERVDSPRFGIATDRRPADACVGNVGQIDIEAMFPEFLTRSGVDAYDLRSFDRRARGIADDCVEPAAHHDGRRPTAQVRVLPEEVAFRTALGVPTIDQTGLCRDSDFVSGHAS